MAFFSTSDVENMDMVLMKAPPYKRAASCASGVSSMAAPKQSTAVDRARARIAAKARAAVAAGMVKQDVQFSSMADVMAAPISHNGLVRNRTEEGTWQELRREQPKTAMAKPHGELRGYAQPTTMGPVASSALKHQIDDSTQEDPRWG